MITQALKRSMQPFLWLFSSIPMIVMMIVLVGAIFIDKWWVIYQFPEENQLVYDIGYLKGRRDAYHCYRDNKRCSYAVTPILTENPYNAIGQEYTCDYTKKSTCFDYEYFPDEYKNQPAKVGYYIKKDFFGNNGTKQLVTLEINGKMIIDYQKSKQKTEENKNPNYMELLMVIIVFMWLPFLLIILGFEFIIGLFYSDKKTE